MANIYQIGQKVRMSGTFYNSAGDLDDPATITFKIRKPDETESDYVFGASAVVRDSVGEYYLEVIPAAGENGVWHYRIVGSGGGVDAAKEDQIQVRASVFTNP